jgi:hypothetical protein
LRGRIRRLAASIGAGGLWDRTRLEDFRNALTASRKGEPYRPRPGIVRAGEMLRLLGIAIRTRRPDERPQALESIGLYGDVSDAEIAARLMERAEAAGFTGQELDGFRVHLARVLERRPTWAA